MSTTDTLLTVADCARIAGVSRMTIHQWINRKKIRAVKISNLYVITTVDLEERMKHLGRTPTGN